MKYRFYFEEYTNQTNSFRVWWSTEATNNEYTVPKSVYNCNDPTTPAENCTHVLKSQFQARDILRGCMVSGDPSACGDENTIATMYGGKFRLTYAAFHCHAPACMLGELWNRDTGELICRNVPEYGEGLEPMDEKVRSSFACLKNRFRSHYHSRATWLEFLPACGDPRRKGSPVPQFFTLIRTSHQLSTAIRQTGIGGSWHFGKCELPTCQPPFEQSPRSFALLPLRSSTTMHM